MRQPALTSTSSFQALESHAAAAKYWQLRELFAADAQRFPKLTVDAAGLFLDYSKNRLDANTIGLLLDLARERGVERQRDAMLNGEKINLTEHRAVLHTALRMPRGKELTIDGQDIAHDVHAVLDHMRDFTDRVRTGAWLGHTGKPITDVVKIGRAHV